MNWNFSAFMPLIFDFVIQQQNQASNLSYANQLAARIDRLGEMSEQTIISLSTVAGATPVAAADASYVDAAGKPFGPIV